MGFVGDGLEVATRLMLDLCGGEASEIVTAGAVPDWRRRYILRATLSLSNTAALQRRSTLARCNRRPSVVRSHQKLR